MERCMHIAGIGCNIESLRDLVGLKATRSYIASDVELQQPLHDDPVLPSSLPFRDCQAITNKKHATDQDYNLKCWWLGLLLTTSIC